MGNVTDEERRELGALGAEMVDAQCNHWSIAGKGRNALRFHDLMKIASGEWIALCFLHDSTGSNWESRKFPTPTAAYVYAELNQWGL